MSERSRDRAGAAAQRTRKPCPAPRAPRTLALLTVCGLVLACTACSSKNEGKIVGKWTNAAEMEGAPAGTITAEFAPDGKFTMSALGMTLITSKYSLGSGEYVSFSDTNYTKGGGDKKKNARVKISITGDTMTWTEDKGSYQFTRDKGGEKK